MTTLQKIIVAFLLGAAWIGIIVVTTYRPELALPLAPVINMIQIALGGLGVLHISNNEQPPSPPPASV